jgi:hypothetical protein
VAAESRTGRRHELGRGPNQWGEIHRNTAINVVDSDDPAEADGAEHAESSPAKEAASRQVKFKYKSQRLIDLEDKRAEAHRKKLEKELAERMHEEEVVRNRERGDEFLREIDMPLQPLVLCVSPQTLMSWFSCVTPCRRFPAR